MTDWPKNKTITEEAIVARYGRSVGVGLGHWLDQQPDAPCAAPANPPCSECKHYDDERCEHPGRVPDSDSGGRYPWAAQGSCPVPGRWNKLTDPAPACFEPKRSKREELVEKLATTIAGTAVSVPFTEARFTEEIRQTIEGTLPANLFGEEE